jgi:protein O-GlcNAcase/histone acetyltransferase
MATQATTDFLAGVIEGFYGKPWSQAERFELFDWMAAWGLNTYLYAPKDDLKHRAIWREPYSPSEAETLGGVIRACQERALRFVYALSPGLDIRYSHETELNQLRRRFEQMLAMGCRDFALLFDDIPDRMDAEDQRRWSSFASAQSHVTNAMFRWVSERSPKARFLFCPTPYCGRMAERKYGGEGYLQTIGRELRPEIDVLWTGPEIISREITVAHVRELAAVLRRKPLIWDNLHANDYDGRRFFCGPYSGRPPQLRDAVAGLLCNPNCEFPLNYVPLRTLAEFVRCPASVEWNAREGYLAAMREWLPRFSTLGRSAALDELVLLGDAYYLPHEDGAEAEALFGIVRALLAQPPENWGDTAAVFRREAARLRDCCTRLAALDDRPLFYALSCRIWELREELDLLGRYVEFKSSPANANVPFGSDFHLPGNYRGGFVARLQGLLAPQSDGTFAPAQTSEPAAPPGGSLS